MNKILVVATALAVSGCAYKPVADLRASGDNAHLYQRDVAECKQLAKEVIPSWTFGFNRVVDQCLKGRGHSVLNVL